jgi:hypothetical protein
VAPVQADAARKSLSGTHWAVEETAAEKTAVPVRAETNQGQVAESAETLYFGLLIHKSS